MKKDILLIEKLIKETQDDSIVWVKADKPEYGFTSQYEKWKGEKSITKNKKIIFVVNNHIDDYRLSEVKVFFDNVLYHKREYIYQIDPGFWSFRTKRVLEELIEVLQTKHNQRVKDRMYNLIGPVNKFWNSKEWEEVVY